MGQQRRRRVDKHGSAQWKPAVFSPSLRIALDILSVRSTVLRSTSDDNSQVPPWVLLALACHKVHTPSDAQDHLLKLTFGNIGAIQTQYKPPLLVLTTLSLAHFGIIAPMRPLVDLFLVHTSESAVFHFNAFLHALSSFARSEEAANLALTILETMTSRQIPLQLHTYRSLMTDRFVTLQLTKYLRSRMTHEGVVPTADHLEAYLRIFSDHGAIHEARQYLRAIQDYCVKHSLAPPYGPVDRPDVQTQGAVHPADTLYLKSLQSDRASAFHYLHNLLQLEGRKQPPQGQSICTHARHPPAQTTFWCGSKHSVDIYDWTTALVSAANDRKITSSALLRLFENARAKTKVFRPTIATYTVLLRGLMWRRSYNEAMRIWNELVDSGLSLDRKALTVGVQVLTRSGHPQDAFYFLDLFSDEQSSHSRPARAPSQSLVLTVSNPSLGTRTPLSRPPSPWINIIVINEFLVSLLRIGRPDIVFKIWDNITLLYGVLPDDVTMNILLKSALLAVKMDRESVRGSVAHFALQTPFRRQWATSSSVHEDGGNDKRAMIVKDIMDSLGTPERPSVLGIWRGKTATDVARDIFRGMILGNWPQMQRVKAPVSAIRPPGNEGAPIAPILELAKSLVVGLSHKAAVNTPREEKAAGDSGRNNTIRDPAYQAEGMLGPGAIPSIHPSSSTFLAYIKLLGLCSPSFAHEIPLALAWMRHLSVRPTRQMLSISLVFWAEVGLRGPIFEEWAEKGGYSEYGRLENWIAEWVREEGLSKEGDEALRPTEEDMYKAIWAVARMRDRNFGRSTR
ncbi:hypothetical protein M404DRAFT_8956 [Pisolithus tinctorius Marx 270]|uniref:Pentacotripeptide-repeat region of PRORP domain-containing protein n=1 Tax=Pisolithus tinctorius Marx 270 TaxID=870435 RepID=A0A0C3K8H9_PISTI|nr:hypothetical protein M404DRAFT_8956 [Pisolithus tinctorius Marx 270]